MKPISADFIRQEVARLGELVVGTAIYHGSGLKLFSAGDNITLVHAKALHASGVQDLFLLDVEEDAMKVRKALGVERVAPKDVVLGDVLMEDLRGSEGGLILAAESVINSANVDRIQAAAFGELVIRHRRLTDWMRQAQEYFAQLPPSDTKGSMTKRMTRVAHVSSTTARHLLIPRARVLVAVSDDPLRIFLANALQSEGHEVIERSKPQDVPEVLKGEGAITVVVLDVEDSAAVLPKLRGDNGLRDSVILVCAKEGEHAPIQEALLAGANDWLPRPPSRDLLNEKIHGCQALLGRRVKLAPSLRAERRHQDRRPGGGNCGLKDPTLHKPLPVVTGEILDIGDGGLRIDYNLPHWPVPWAYMVHGVHPRHFFYVYAMANPHGRDLVVTFSGPAGQKVERPVRVARVSPAGELETLSLVFPEVKGKGTTTSFIRKF
jgi:CheY-like chemotaxis protein